MSSPPARVWDCLIDGRRWHDWNADVAWMTIDDRLAIGRYLTIKPTRGRQTAYRIARLEIGRALTLQLSFGPLARLANVWTIEAAGSGTSITWRVEIGGPLAAWLVKKAAVRSAVEMREAVLRLADLAARA